MPFVHIPDPDQTEEDRRRSEKEADRFLRGIAIFLLSLLVLRIYFNEEFRAMEERRHAEKVEECRTDPEGCVARIEEAERKARGGAGWLWLLLLSR